MKVLIKEVNYQSNNKQFLVYVDGQCALEKYSASSIDLDLETKEYFKTILSAIATNMNRNVEFNDLRSSVLYGDVCSNYENGVYYELIEEIKSKSCISIKTLNKLKNIAEGRKGLIDKFIKEKTKEKLNNGCDSVDIYCDAKPISGYYNFSDKRPFIIAAVVTKDNKEIRLSRRIEMATMIHEAEELAIDLGYKIKKSINKKNSFLNVVVYNDNSGAVVSATQKGCENVQWIGGSQNLADKYTRDSVIDKIITEFFEEIKILTEAHRFHYESYEKQYNYMMDVYNSSPMIKSNGMDKELKFIYDKIQKNAGINKKFELESFLNTMNRILNYNFIIREDIYDNTRTSNIINGKKLKDKIIETHKNKEGIINQLKAKEKLILETREENEAIKKNILLLEKEVQEKESIISQYKREIEELNNKLEKKNTRRTSKKTKDEDKEKIVV